MLLLPCVLGILSLCVYNIRTVSTTCARCTPPMHSVYRLYPGKRVRAQCLQTAHSVYKLCTVSTCMHSVYRLCSGKRTCAQCLQSGAQCLHVILYTRLYVYADSLYRDGVSIHTYVYTRIRVYVYAHIRMYMCTCILIRVHVYTPTCIYVHSCGIGMQGGWMGGVHLFVVPCCRQENFLISPVSHPL